MINNQRILSITLISIGTLTAIFFGMRAFRSFMHMRSEGPFKQTDKSNIVDLDLIRDSMTVPYIAQTYGLPGGVIFRMMNIPHQSENLEKSLKALNDEFYPESDGIILLYVKAAVQAYQLHQPPPPFPSTPLPAAPSTPLIRP